MRSVSGSTHSIGSAVVGAPSGSATRDQVLPPSVDLATWGTRPLGPFSNVETKALPLLVTPMLGSPPGKPVSTAAAAKPAWNSRGTWDAAGTMPGGGGGVVGAGAGGGGALCEAQPARRATTSRTATGSRIGPGLGAGGKEIVVPQPRRGAADG